MGLCKDCNFSEKSIPFLGDSCYKCFNLKLNKFKDNLFPLDFGCSYWECKEVLKDKVGKVIQEGDFLSVNPTDDDWLAFVVRHDRRLMFASELDNFDAVSDVSLRDVLFGSDNPAIIVGNIHESRIDFGEF